MENTSVDMTEVAEPSIEETGVEVQDVAAPESNEHQKNTPDAAFAEMRRARENAERERADALAELEILRAENEAREQAFAKLTGAANGDVAALAEVTGMSEDEIIATMEEASESVQKDLRISQLEAELNNVTAEKVMQQDLDEIRKIDPTVTSLSELGKDYGAYIRSGLTARQAYYACKGEEIANKATPPKAVGKVSTAKGEPEKYTESEIDAMSSDQLKKNWKKVFSSWG